MMAAHSVSIDKYSKGKRQVVLIDAGLSTVCSTSSSIGQQWQMQGVTKLESHSEEKFEGMLAEAPNPTLADPQTPMDVDKTSIYRHPLFPLLALLFEKCEQSTLSSECITSASFDVDIENFVRSQEKDGKPFFSEDPELDNLMVKAIQVLRIHLLELEKVSDLCKDFCSRYIACLKTKMNSETLLSGDPGSPYSPVQSQAPSFSPTKSQVPCSISGSPHGQIVVPASALQQGNVTVTAVNPTQVVAGMSSWHTTTPTGGTVYQPVTVVTHQGQVVTQAISPGTLRVQNNQLQLRFHQDLNLFNHDDSSTKNKRGVLPKHATNVMRSWLFQHIGHPYPTEDEKKQIASQTNLTLLQVNNWFINARRRILQPMLDASSSETPKTKKKTPQNRPLQRFWPDSIASGGGTPQQVTMPDGTMVTMNVEGLHSLTSDGATLAVQQVMLGSHSEDESGDSGDDDDDADMTGLALHNSDSLQ
ncbi:homeobox protein PKNOX1.1 isoform X6 [Syngnathus scovelli]|uniref:homeobox protein PKNOX1.1 isoform X6 n=1 Tax=Syngnathus scovelli TaxID=161590 RepID=UPI002110C26E|nr:homeobox protein PKNOX1.1 isoform X5 [Syngnathus scovelli]XP_049584373.1 homeobox protein PKNOX1.1 isoform X5 [Syngnathus scovelli]XP_049584374.1 homeobox protein PKNOX1.1 isoform X5 [Syngnathus scovelli]XP_049584375.1 homeobox protein PKNOX1.1 isoform X5 [Syngnathus scovelli]XP_049584376.1 homeobox protein PKNOX1.1 isoform X5 [Syngnathus scovelli]XP_049584378.1 homeobox protein PKNOX1.1 isoform X5 [Syngnathus scovelli]XP_049584379.1 homeobox protein PKNOX1.1 isoform X5 [Syngnathus scovell